MARQMKDSGVEWIGKVPKEWEIKKLKYVSDTRNEKYDSACGELDYFGLENIVGGTGEFILTSNSYDLEQSQLCMENDVVFGKLRPYLAKVFLVDKNRCCSSEFAVFTNFDGVSVFYKYLFMSCGFIKAVDASTYGTKMPRVNIDFMNNMFIPVPLSGEQQKIVHLLDEKVGEIDSVIVKTKETIDEYKRYKESIITHVVIKGLNQDVKMMKSEVEWLEVIPGYWKEKKLKQCVYIRARLGWKGLKADEYVENGYPFLSAFNIINNKLDFTETNYINQFRYDESPEIKLSVGDVLLVKDGAGIGKCAYIDCLPQESTVNGSIAVLTTVESLLGKYLYYFLLSKLMQKYVDRIKGGMGVPHLFQKDIREIRIPIPPLKEQKEIVTYLDEKCFEIDNLIAKKNELLTDLESYKKSLIYEYATGKKEVI